MGTRGALCGDRIFSLLVLLHCVLMEMLSKNTTCLSEYLFVFFNYRKCNEISVFTCKARTSAFYIQWKCCRNLQYNINKRSNKIEVIIFYKFSFSADLKLGTGMIFFWNELQRNLSLNIMSCLNVNLLSLAIFALLFPLSTVAFFIRNQSNAARI